MALASALYSGLVRHRRHAPRQHAFKYRTSLLLLDLDEQREVFSLSKLWSGRWFSPMRFRESDYLSNERVADESLKACAQRVVTDQLGVIADGSIQLLTQVRSFGFVFNPVSFFYCYDRAGLRFCRKTSITGCASASPQNTCECIWKTGTEHSGYLTPL